VAEGVGGGGEGERGTGWGWQAGAPGCTLPTLKAATVALAAQSVQLMMGICAEDQAAGVRALKAWTQGLGLPKVIPKTVSVNHAVTLTALHLLAGAV
jgi:hypothetical protein